MNLEVIWFTVWVWSAGISTMLSVVMREDEYCQKLIVVNFAKWETRDSQSSFILL